MRERHIDERFTRAQFIIRYIKLWNKEVMNKIFFSSLDTLEYLFSGPLFSIK